MKEISESWHSILYDKCLGRVDVGGIDYDKGVSTFSYFEVTFFLIKYLDHTGHTFSSKRSTILIVYKNSVACSNLKVRTFKRLFYYVLYMAFGFKLLFSNPNVLGLNTIQFSIFFIN